MTIAVFFAMSAALAKPAPKQQEATEASVSDSPTFVDWCGTAKPKYTPNWQHSSDPKGLIHYANLLATNDTVSQYQREQIPRMEAEGWARLRSRVEASRIGFQEWQVLQLQYEIAFLGCEAPRDEDRQARVKEMAEVDSNVNGLTIEDTKALYRELMALQTMRDYDYDAVPDALYVRIQGELAGWDATSTLAGLTPFESDLYARALCGVYRVACNTEGNQKLFEDIAKTVDRIPHELPDYVRLYLAYTVEQDGYRNTPRLTDSTYLLSRVAAFSRSEVDSELLRLGLSQEAVLWTRMRVDALADVVEERRDALRVSEDAAHAHQYSAKPGELNWDTPVVPPKPREGVDANYDEWMTLYKENADFRRAFEIRELSLVARPPQGCADELRGALLRAIGSSGPGSPELARVLHSNLGQTLIAAYAICTRSEGRTAETFALSSLTKAPPGPWGYPLEMPPIFTSLAYEANQWGVIAKLRTEGENTVITFKAEKWQEDVEECAETNKIDHISADGSVHYQYNCWKVGVETESSQHSDLTVATSRVPGIAVGQVVNFGYDFPKAIYQTDPATGEEVMVNFLGLAFREP